MIPNKLKGDYIHTFTGKHFSAADPQPDQICIEDIAHALSLVCRFGGHCDKFYSVAQHSVIISYLCSVENKMQALMHDAAEAYTGDMPKPFKRMLPDFQNMEQRIQVAVCEAFDLDTELPEEIHCLDSMIVVNEATDLFHIPVEWAAENTPVYLDSTSRVTDDAETGTRLEIFTPWVPAFAEKKFLEQYCFLTGKTLEIAEAVPVSDIIVPDKRIIVR